MPIERTPQDSDIIFTISGLSHGLDSQSSPTQTKPTYVPEGLQNCGVPGGSYRRLDGATLHAAACVMPDGQAATFADVYVASATGAQTLLAGGQDGHVYKWTGTAYQSLRRGLSTTAGLWWSTTQIGDYLIVTNPEDGHFKYDGTRFLPLGAKNIADFDTTTAWTGNGVLDTTNIKQGVAGRKITSTGGASAQDYYTPTPWGLTAGLLEGRDYADTDYIHFWAYIDTAANIDTTNTWITLSQDYPPTAYFKSPASAWGTLADGWNEISILRSSFTPTGGPAWANLAVLLLQVDATGTSNLNITFDDLYTSYANPMPASQFNANWKNMYIAASSTAAPSSFYFSKVSAPDEHDPSAEKEIDANDGTSITGLFPYFDLFLVTKDNSVHTQSVRLEGQLYPDYIFGGRRATTEHGCSSHRGMVDGGGKVYMPWRGKLYQFSGVGTAQVSYPVEPTLGDFEPTRLQHLVGAPYRPLNHIYWWWTPEGGSTNSSGLVYDYREEAFLPVVGQSVALAKNIVQDEIEYLLTMGYTGRLLHQDDGTTWDGTAITATIPMPWISGGPPHPVLSWREVQVSYGHQTSGSLLVQYRVAGHPREFDAASWVTAGTIDMSVAGERGRVLLGERGRWCQIRFQTVGAPLDLYWPVMVRGTVLGFGV